MSAFGTHPDTASVVARDVAASEVERTGVVEGSIATDVEVITGIGSEAALGVIAQQLFYGVVLTGSGVGAMQDDEINLPPHMRQVRMQP